MKLFLVARVSQTAPVHHTGWLRQMETSKCPSLCYVYVNNVVYELFPLLLFGNLGKFDRAPIPVAIFYGLLPHVPFVSP